MIIRRKLYFQENHRIAISIARTVMGTESNMIERGCWVLATKVDDALVERLGDARRVANQLSVSTGVLIIGQAPADIQELIHRGADHVCNIPMDVIGQRNIVAAASEYLLPQRPRVLFAA